jgi:holin-like protein
MSEWRGTALNVIAQLGIIFGICLISEGISALLPFAMPASIIGMLLLLLMLILKIVKTEQIRSVTDFLIGNLPFFFVPAVVGLINYLDILSANALKMVLVVFVSMAATFAATMWAVRLTIRLMERGKK